MYNKRTYNCAHFVSEVWEHITGFDVSHIMQGFLLPPGERKYTKVVRQKFHKLDCPESPCIVLMQRPHVEPHVGLFYNRKVLHITKQGVQFVPLDVATLGFSKVGYYKC